MFWKLSPPVSDHLWQQWQTTVDQKPHKSAAFAPDRMCSGYLLKVVVKPYDLTLIFPFCIPWDACIDSKTALCFSVSVHWTVERLQETQSGVLWKAAVMSASQASAVIEIRDSTTECEEETSPSVVQKEEKAFVSSLHTFMKDRGSPIERIPHLGFKQSEFLIAALRLNKCNIRKLDIYSVWSVFCS